MECGVRRRAPGLRIKTENKGFAGSRAQTAPALQREKRKISASGLRIKTENKGFAGSQAQTARLCPYNGVNSKIVLYLFLGGLPFLVSKRAISA